MRHRRHQLVIATTAATAVALLLSSCASEKPDGPTSESASDVHQIGHVHGLGIDPADDTLYVAGHLGVFRIDEDGVPTRVADRWQDTMAFTVTGPNTFLGSGHPDLREDLPPHLGLIESKDAAQTWEALSLQGEADFHAVEVIDDRIFGYDSTSGQILTTTDRTTWETVTSGQFIDLAAVPGQANRVLATTGEGELVEVTLTSQDTAVADAPTLAWIDTTPTGELVGASPDGEIYATDLTTGDWEQRGSVAGQPTALNATDTVWYVATDSGIYASQDHGATWTPAVGSTR